MRPDITPDDRLGLTVCVAGIVHAVLILGVSFGSTSPPGTLYESLEIILMPERTEQVIDDVDGYGLLVEFVGLPVPVVKYVEAVLTSAVVELFDEVVQKSCLSYSILLVFAFPSSVKILTVDFFPNGGLVSTMSNLSPGSISNESSFLT